MRVMYLVHDLDDAAVGRRSRFLREGGASVRLAGFRRRTDPVMPDPDRIVLGVTENGRMAKRAVSTLAAAASSARWHRALIDADIIVARTLEMLLLATLVRARVGSRAPIVYECLDIHRLMTGTRLPSRLLRGVERRLLRSCARLVVSSPRFIDRYFEPAHARLPPWTLLENKLLSSELAKSGPPADGVPATPPWRIGWFGVIRCARSLELLVELVRASNGTVEIDIAGRPALDVIPEFHATVSSTPGLRFLGPYDRSLDLPRLYGAVHFTWAIDFYEEGLNSTWLLPNRLYEGTAFGTVPIALAGVETGAWLAGNSCGLRLEAPLQRMLPALFASMTPAGYEAARGRVLSLDRSKLIETEATASAFVASIAPPSPTRIRSGAADMTSQIPPFSIVVPVLDEARYIRQALGGLLDQVRDLDCDIMVMDGGSADSTRAIVTSIARTDPRVRLVDNPGRTQSAACNLASRLIDPSRRIMLRADAHAGYPPGFVARTIDALRETGATSVVVPMRTRGTSPTQRAIAATQNSRLGNGGSGHRRAGVSRFVDHGHHAAFDTAFFRALGGYDESFTHNEDAEFDVRGGLAGGRIWMCAEAAIDYYPRDRLSALARQYVRHGRGRARTLRKHGLRPRLRQCLPLAILASAALALLSPVSPWFALPASAYLFACLAWGATEAARRRDPALGLMGPAAIVMHLGWAVGFIDGLSRPDRLASPSPADTTEKRADTSLADAEFALPGE